MVVWHLKLSSQNHILFFKFFFDNAVNPLGKYMWKELFNSLLFLIFCLPENNKTISRKLILWEFKNGSKNFTILLSRNFQFLLSISSWQTHKRKKKLSVYRTISIYNLLENTDIELRGSLLRSMSVSYSIVCKILNLFSDFFFFFVFFKIF